MNYKEAGFRAFYHHFCMVPITEKTRPAIEGMKGIEQSNGILTWGYYDREAGLTLEVMGLGFVDGKKALFSDPIKEMRSYIRIGAVEEEDFLYFADDDGRLAKKYADKLKNLEAYRVGEEIEKTREMPFLDDSRHEVFIDDISVYLLREGCEPEWCWVRICGLSEHVIKGILLNEPDQDFGCHEGDEIEFQLRKDENNKLICCADRNPVEKLQEEAMEDGSLLAYAVSAFYEERTLERFLSVLQILRDSSVWIPCSREEAPELIRNGEKYYIPVFSDKRLMGTKECKVRKAIPEVIRLACALERCPDGIVLNPFSEPFVLEEKLWSLVESLPSRL